MIWYLFLYLEKLMFTLPMYTSFQDNTETGKTILLAIINNMKIVSATKVFSHIWYIFHGGTKSNIFLCTLPNI